MRRSMALAKVALVVSRRRHRYVVGYVYDGNTVYGKGYSGNGVSCTHPLTLWQARRRLAEMPDPNCAIFELVPIAVREREG